jgi:hypothetical protein
MIISNLQDKAPNLHGRVIDGMCLVIAYDKDEVIDPDANMLEFHPRIKK